MHTTKGLIKFEGLTSTEGYEQPSGAKRYLVAMPGNEKRRGGWRQLLQSKAGEYQMITFSNGSAPLFGIFCDAS